MALPFFEPPLSGPPLTGPPGRVSWSTCCRTRISDMAIGAIDIFVWSRSSMCCARRDASALAAGRAPGREGEATVSAAAGGTGRRGWLLEPLLRQMGDGGLPFAAPRARRARCAAAGQPWAARGARARLACGGRAAGRGGGRRASSPGGAEGSLEAAPWRQRGAHRRCLRKGGCLRSPRRAPRQPRGAQTAAERGPCERPPRGQPWHRGSRNGRCTARRRTSRSA